MERMKEIWNNRKTRGIIFIVLYVILFSYIFIVYGKKSEKIILPESKPTKIEKKELSSYEYDYVLDDESVNIIKNNNVTYFKKDEIDYYYIDDNCYKLEEEKFVKVDDPLKYNFDYLNKIDNIISISNPIKTISYHDGNIEENYDVNMAQLLEIFGLQEEVDGKTMMNYSIVKSNNNIIEIRFNTINLSIKYKNFKDIPEINIDYEFKEKMEEE